MNTNKIRSWATVDEKGNIIALCASREEARKQKKYAAQNGWKQRVAKLQFSEFSR